MTTSGADPAVQPDTANAHPGTANAQPGTAQTQLGTAGTPPADQHVVTVTVRYFASARAAVGVDSETVRLPASASVGDAIEHVRRLHADRLPRILDACGFLLDGVAVRDSTRSLPHGSQVDILPPFAGG